MNRMAELLAGCLILSLTVILLSSTVYADENYDLILKAERQHINLTDKDKDVLKNGELGTERYVLGGIIGTYPGFGIGHAIQGRWGTKGWIFTAGETASLFVIVAGASSMDFYDENSKGLATVSLGALAFAGFHIWEIIDVWYGGNEQRKEYDYLKNKINENAPDKLSWFTAPFIQKNSCGLSVGLTF